MNAIFQRSNYISPLRWPKQFLSDLKCCIDRCRKGYCERDLWDINDWFLAVVPDMLEELSKSHCGFPSYLEREYYEQHKDKLGMTFHEFICCPVDKDSDGYKVREQANRECSEHWSRILCEIAYYLREAKDDATDSKDAAYRAGYLRKGMDLLAKHFDDLWD